MKKGAPPTPLMKDFEWPAHRVVGQHMVKSMSLRCRSHSQKLESVNCGKHEMEGSRLPSCPRYLIIIFDPKRDNISDT